MINFDVDTSSFQSFTREAIKNLDVESQLKVLRGFALKFIGEVVPKTPVDTGQARGGWTAMKGSVTATQGGFGRIGPGAVEGRRKSSYTETKRGGQVTLIIHNGVPHIVYLELGSSQQAPSGFVRQTMREMAKDLTEDMRREIEAELRLANIHARRTSGLRQGIGRRPSSGRLNIARR